jgi:hypothetical protein
MLPGRASPDFYTSAGFIDETSPWAEVERVCYLLLIRGSHRREAAHPSRHA